MIESFFTIDNKEYSAEIVEKKSRFIAELVKVNSEDEVNNVINRIKKQNRDAKHNVFAYRLSNGLERFSDDGEPSGTAGVPILDILRGKKLQNVLVVVTRYFGGILLGTGGLVRAYSSAAKNAVESANIIEAKLCNKYEVVTEYIFHNILLHYFNRESIEIENVTFSDKVCLDIVVNSDKSAEVIDNIMEKTKRTAEIINKETYYHEKM